MNHLRCQTVRRKASKNCVFLSWLFFFLYSLSLLWKLSQNATNFLRRAIWLSFRTHFFFVTNFPCHSWLFVERFHPSKRLKFLRKILLRSPLNIDLFVYIIYWVFSFPLPLPFFYLFPKLYPVSFGFLRETYRIQRRPCYFKSYMPMIQKGVFIWDPPVQDFDYTCF